MPEEILYRIALTQIPQVGAVTLKKLLEYFGSATDIFRAGTRELERMSDIGPVKAAAIKGFRDFARAESELRFITHQRIRPLFYTDPGYPQRLKHCVDAPVLLYFKGRSDLNAPRMVNIIGTRQPSAYGIAMCENIVKGLSEHKVTIVSGMAYGIDITAHRAAIRHQIPTIGVLAHGLDRLYPAMHQYEARQMQVNGGLLTDFMSRTLPDRQNFPKRNRIVAGLCDATIVIESGLKGGSLITADIANSYNRDVMTVPGRVSDTSAAGCHYLVQTNKAALVTSAQDILELMGWERAIKPKPVVQRDLFVTLSPAEEQVMSLFRNKTPRHIEEIYLYSRLPGSEVAHVLFRLEMQQVLRCLPGQQYEPV